MESPLVLVVDDEALLLWTWSAPWPRSGSRWALATSANLFLKDRTPAAAVLDVRLSDGECYEAAKTLTERGVPFVVYTGVDVEGSHEAFSNGVTVLKPTESAEVVRLVGVMTAERQQKMTG